MTQSPTMSISAEEPRRGSRGTVGVTVRPQPVTEQSYMESVFTFLHDVVPQAYSGGSIGDGREKVLWVRFDEADINDVGRNSLFEQCPGPGDTSPLLLTLGYSNGLQIWSLPESGEAQEVFSIRHGPVRTARLLPAPLPVLAARDLFTEKRPLLATCDSISSSVGQAYCAVDVRSLRTGDVVKSIQFKTPIFDILANQRILLVALQEKVAAFDACSFSKKFFITSCFPSSGPNPNPLALGARWLAYSDNKLVQRHQSYGGVSGDAVQSYTATVISAAKTIKSGLSLFGEAVGRLTSGRSLSSSSEEEGAIAAPRRQPLTQGVVTITDIERAQGQVQVSNDHEGDAIVAHFPAHDHRPISALAFDASGMLLVTADCQGHDFHVFRILAHPLLAAQAAVRHLYTLHRGDTEAQVQDITMSQDSRWVAVTTLRGTSHVFPINPYGGSPCARTHLSPRVVNRVSRFQRSAGLEEIEADIANKPTGRSNSPVPSLSPSPSASPCHSRLARQESFCNRINNNPGNPRLPPFPHPMTIAPLIQVRQPVSLGRVSKSPGKNKGGGSPQQTCSKGSSGMELCVATRFAPSRCQFLNSTAVSREKDRASVVDNLFVACSYGMLLEYQLDLQPAFGAAKISDESSLDLLASPRCSWTLARSALWDEARPPFDNNHPLLLASDTVRAWRGRRDGQSCTNCGSNESLSSDPGVEGEEWLSQVEIVTHTGPHRRLWMGPQFQFKTVQSSGQTMVLSSSSSALLSQGTPEPLQPDIMDLHSLRLQPVRSDPVTMPRPSSAPRAAALEIEAGSGMFEQNSLLLEVSHSWPDSSAIGRGVTDPVDEGLRERIADAMVESPGVCPPDHAVELRREGSIETLSNSSGSTSGSFPRAYESYRASLPGLDTPLSLQDDDG
uniref:BCAS3 microtubule associated cell migration factor isoform X1 n=1 Tax=Myxine glutinosa TaxID=7769 RepID=UPI00358F517D